MTAVLAVLTLLLTPVDSDDPGWVVCIEILDREEHAESLRVEVARIASSPINCLWIPEWESMTDYKGWLVYSGPWDSADEAASAACEFLYRFPEEAFAIWIGCGEARDAIPAEAQDFDDLKGLMPDPEAPPRLGPHPREWLVEVSSSDDGEMEERPRAEVLKFSLSGWDLMMCIDPYVGSLEKRAYRTGSFDAEEQYEIASDFLKRNADAVGALVWEDAGRYTIVHRLPNPEDREGDTDIWVALRNDTLEYGSRIRLFYGEMPYSWPYIPENIHSSLVPDIVRTEEEAIDFLMGVLTWSGAYSGQFPEGYSLGIAYLDNLPEDVYRDYYDIAIREVHRPGGPGDPDISPVIDRFRVYTRGEVIWWPLYGEFVPFEECLEDLFPE